MIEYEIISTGSQGNAVVLNGNILIDCGVPYSAIKGYVPKLKLVLLTHIHGDHFRKSTIKRLAMERPSLRFGCGDWLVAPLERIGVPLRQIDVLRDGKMYGYGKLCNVIPVPLVHNVPNQGYKVHINGQKIIYCTDTGNLNGVSAPDYDLYMIEANHHEDEIRQKIADHKEKGEFAYEMRVIRDHLSVEQCDDFIYQNIGHKGRYIYMHCHQENDEDGNTGENN